MQPDPPERTGRRIACLAIALGKARGDAPLVHVARAFSPWVEIAADGTVYFDARGCGALHRDEANLAAAVCEAAGDAAQVAIAGSKATARLVAAHRAGTGRFRVVPPGRDRETLAPLPLGVLRPSPVAAAALRRWGIPTLGALAALPRGEVALRLGAEGSRLWEIAAGGDAAPLVPTPQPDEPEEAVDLEFPIYEIEPLLFVLRGVLDRLAARLAERGVVFGAVALRLRTEGEAPTPARDGWWIAFAEPLRDVPAILALLRVSIESRPPRGAVVGACVRAIPAGGRTAQLSFFEPAGPSPQKLAVTLARLGALVGPHRVGMPRRADEHRSAAPLPLRVLRPPLAVEGECSSVVPPSRLATADARLRGAVVRASGPWKLRGGWWSDTPLARDYWDVELAGGTLLRLFCDTLGGGWFVDGVYD